jgi:hypothetical protein
VSGTITLRADARAPNGVAKVEFYRVTRTGRAERIATETAPVSGAIYAASFDTHRMSNGDHPVYAIVYDTDGNAVKSAEVTVRASN